MTIYRNAAHPSTDTTLPFRIGAGMLVTAYGMYGFAILCSPDFRKTMDFAKRYHALAAPLAAIEFREIGDIAIWNIAPLGDAKSIRNSTGSSSDFRSASRFF